jgi:hypothetical protein
LINGAFVPVDAEPLQYIDRFHRGIALDARAVEIFDPQQDSPAALPGDGPVHEKRAGVSEMQRSSRRRGKTRSEHHRVATRRHKKTQKYVRPSVERQ